MLSYVTLLVVLFSTDGTSQLYVQDGLTKDFCHEKGSRMVDLWLSTAKFAHGDYECF